MEKPEQKQEIRLMRQKEEKCIKNIILKIKMN